MTHLWYNTGVIYKQKPRDAANIRGAINLRKRSIMDSIQQDVTYIYLLKDPRDNQVYYVGKSDNPEKRLKEHVNDKKTNRHKRDWIDSLLNDGLQPLLEVAECVSLNCWSSAEVSWIERGLKEGWPLTNILTVARPVDPRDELDKLVYPMLSIVPWVHFCGLKDGNEKRQIFYILFMEWWKRKETPTTSDTATGLDDLAMRILGAGGQARAELVREHYQRALAMGEIAMVLLNARMRRLNSLKG